MRAISPLALLALFACHGADIDALGDTDPVGAPVGDPGTSPASSQAKSVHMAPAIELSKELSGTAVVTDKVGPWKSRTAGSSGFGGSRRGYAEGLAMPSEAMDSAAVYEAEADMAGPPMPAPPMKSAERYTGGRPSHVAQAPALRAGTTDDNADYGQFLSFLDTWSARPELGSQAQHLDVRDRLFVEVVDLDGAPLPGVPFEVRGAWSGKTVWQGTTYGDGRAPYYPHLAADIDEPLAVTAQLGSAIATAPWTTERDTVTVALAASPQDAAVKLDVVFLIDTTGSMADEIQRIQDTLLATTQQIRKQKRPVDLQYGAVLYRDIGDEYLTRALPLTRDVDRFDQVIQEIRADGGGDGPESLNQGLAVAIGDTDWREGAAKVVFLVADAPPHMDYQGDLPYGTSAAGALARGVRVHTVAASGLDDLGSLVFRQTAQLTRGKFIFIEYGSTAASAADHGVTGRVSSNNLDAILFEQLRSEIEGWGQPAGRVASR